MTPTVSINLCCYNSEKYLEETLESIFAQTYKDWELIIINDGSSDLTETIVDKFTNQGYPINYHYQQNKGIGASRNEALKYSSGEYIAFIDHDDTWMPEKLAKQMALFESNPEAGLVYCDFYNVYPNGKKIIGSRFFRYYKGFIFIQLLVTNFIALSTIIVRKDLVLDEGGFPPYSIAEDYALLLKIAKKCPVDFIDAPLVEYLYHESNSSRNLELTLRESEEIFNHWAEQGDEEINKIIKKSMGRMHYGLSRAALFKLNNKRLAINYIKRSLRYQAKLQYYIFYVFCFLPIRLIRLVRKSIISLLSC